MRRSKPSAMLAPPMPPITSARRAPQLLLLAASLTVFPACNNDKPAEFIGQPFCVSPDGTTNPRFAKQYIAFTHYRNGHSMSPLDAGWHGHGPVGGVFTNKLDMWVVGCPDGEEIRAPQGWEELLAKGIAPVVCAGQELVYQGGLELETSERATAMGRRGYLRFPKMELECVDGELSFEERLLFSQIIGSFGAAVDAYQSKHKQLPPSAEVIYTEMLEPELPPDPWGTALRVTNTGDALEVRSAGPNTTFDDDDDIEVLTQRRDGSTGSLGWPGLEPPDIGTGSYAALLDRQGVAHSL